MTFKRFQLEISYLLRFTPERAAVSNCPIVDKYVFVWFANTKGDELGKYGSGHLDQVWMERHDFCLIVFKDLECYPMRKYDIRCAMVHDGPVPQCEKNELAKIVSLPFSLSLTLSLSLSLYLSTSLSLSLSLLNEMIVIKVIKSRVHTMQS